MTKRQREKAQKAFEEFEMLTGWPPHHQEAVLAGEMELQKALVDEVRIYRAWSKKADACIKALVAKL
jgi:hypothetical protein